MKKMTTITLVMGLSLGQISPCIAAELYRGPTENPLVSTSSPVKLLEDPSLSVSNPGNVRKVSEEPSIITGLSYATKAALSTAGWMYAMSEYTGTVTSAVKFVVGSVAYGLTDSRFVAVIVKHAAGAVVAPYSPYIAGGIGGLLPLATLYGVKAAVKGVYNVGQWMLSNPSEEQAVDAKVSASSAAPDTMPETTETEKSSMGSTVKAVGTELWKTTKTVFAGVSNSVKSFASGLKSLWSW